MTSPAGDGSPTTARLLITRTSARDVQNRQIFASLDGHTIGDLLFSETLDREIAPGPHRLRVHNTLFWKNLYFDAVPGETVHFEVVNYAGRGFLSLVLLIGAAPLFLAVERKDRTATGHGNREMKTEKGEGRREKA